MRYDAAVIGGGFYGAFLALYLSERFSETVLLEKEDTLLARASFVNQARLHNGYHYPRSFQTASRSHLNVANFVRDFPSSVFRESTAFYCIARDSKISSRHFERFCERIGAPLRPAPQEVVDLFSRRRIDAVYEVEEFGFDSYILRDSLIEALNATGVDVRTGTPVSRVETASPETVDLVIGDGADRLTASWVFNCTYAGLNTIPGVPPQPPGVLRHQIVEIPIIKLPEALHGKAFTVVDGPFFGTLPFPALDAQSIYHVRYSPHFSWLDEGANAVDPYEVLEKYSKESKLPYMLRDASRYLPAISASRHVESLFEVRTLLANTTVDDARPILLDRSADAPRVVTLLGGKIDNIYDLFHALEKEEWLK